MPEEMDVEIRSQWDGVDQQTTRIADLVLKFADFNPPEAIDGPSTTELMLLMDLEKEVQVAADSRWGRNRVKVDCVQILRGSLEVLVTLTAVGGAVYGFFKDYQDLRAGILLFVAVLRAGSAELRWILRKHLKPRGGGTPGGQDLKKEHGSSA